MAVSRTAVLLGLLLLGVCSVYGQTQVTSFEPDHAHIQGSVILSVRGCGFRSHSTVVCVFDERYYSPVHIIQSDDLIYCTTPEIPREDFDTLPHFSTLSVVFDGDEGTTIPVTDSFRFGPAADHFTPFDGYVLGGEIFHVVGDGFSDFSTARVLFDGKDCLNPVIHSDNEILCEVPEGEFNQNAIIDVLFDDNPKFFLHFDRTYHYGPVLYGISPACGNFLGGTEVTILGINLDDPTLTLEAPPAGVGPTVEILYNDGNSRAIVNNVDLDPVKNLITFPAPAIGIAFGAEVEFAVYFKSVNSKVRITPRDCAHFDCQNVNTSFTYGPVLLATVNPNNGFLGGGDTVTIQGCGFSDFAPSDLSILVGGSELCERPVNGTDTLRVNSTGDRDTETVTCRTTALPCGSDVNALPIDVEYRVNGNAISTQSAGTFTSGPSIDASTLNPTRGPRTGRDLTTINGENFFFNSGSTAANPGWTVTAHFTAVDDPSLTLNSVPVTVVSNEQLSFRTPVGLFDLDVNVSFTFENTEAGVCGDYPRVDADPVYHFGPVCTDVTPVNGHYSGNSPLTVIGEGFTEDNNLIADTEIRLCIDRLSDADGCTFEPHARDSTFTLADDEISIVTPDVRQGVSTPVGGNRVFGDTASVWVHFTQPGADNVEFPRNQLRPGLNVARIQCPATYRFGPIVESVTPNKGPNGPRGAGSPGQEITIKGSFLADPALDNTLNEVDLGGIKAFNVNTVDDETITAQTLWGNDAFSTTDVRVIFDTCNQTFSDATLKWGPQLDRIVAANTGATGGDLYGLVPGGGDTIDIFGSGFTAFDDVAVYIDGTAVAFTIVSDSEIRATTPCRTFGTVATLTVVFGTICNSDAPDFQQTLVADQLLRYTPRIDSISPKSGLTSGATSVTITGEGFTGYGKYECFFGHYSDQVHYTPSIDGRQLVCQTPINRGEFNTDVTVHVQLAADDDDDSASLARSVLATADDDDECDQNNGDFFRQVTYPGIEDWDMKVISPETFHYGPVCTGVSETRCPLGGCTAVQSVVGTGFQDCLFNNADPTARDLSYPWQDCVFKFYEVRFVDPVTGEVTVADLPTSNSTSATGNSATNLRFISPAYSGDAIVEVEFFFPATSTDPSVTSQTTITCGVEGTPVVSYGPVFASQSSTYYDAATATSYGWGGDSVTITGVGFTDPEIFAGVSSVRCAVGGVAGTVTSVQSTLAVCVVPDGAFDTTGDITLSWSGANQDASITAQSFHYGPVIRSLSPERGMVEAATEITVSGFAFECCGITSYECAFPADAEVTDDTSYIGGDSVTCTVPKNEFIDRQINNVGVKFSSPLFNTPDFTFSETFTEQETALRFYYGPIVTDVYFEDLPTLSARDQFVIIEGEGFDDPYLLEAYCDFFDTTGNGVNNIPFNPLEKTAQTATTLRCPILEYSHNCNAVDVIRPRWRRGLIEEYQADQVQNYWKTVAPELPEEDSEPFFSNAGSTEAEFYGPLVYGPNILSVCSGSLCGDDLPVSPIEGGLDITITFDSLRDFVGVTPGSVGSEKAFCVFGSRRALTTSDIIADPLVDGQATITCTTPPGAVDMTGDISVILSPNMNEDTKIDDGYFWLPTASGLSRNFGFPSGRESLVVYGSGFCNYDNVYCLFDNFEGVQGDITSDREVTCETPLHAPGEVTVSLRFCNAGDSCDCTTFGSEDIVTVPEKFTYVGVTNVVPSEGPICGGTNVTYSGFGFEFFDSFTCVLGGVTAPAVANDASGILCTTPDISSRFAGINAESVECLNTQIFGTAAGQAKPIFNPFKFEFGVPELVRVEPASVDIDDLASTTLRVHGEYINGESFDPETLQCIFGGEFVVPGVLVDAIDALKVIECPAPAVESVGRYDLTVRYSCGGAAADVFTSNRIAFSVTQSPVVEHVRPTFSPEIGGVTVTIEGEDFNGNGLVLCAFGVLGSGDEKIVGSLGFDENGSILCKTPAFPVTRNTDLPLYVSLDGGAVWQTATNDFLIEDIVAADDDEC